MMSFEDVKGGDGAAEEQIQRTNEHPLRIAALRRFRAKLFAWLEDMGACAGVDLTGEGECVIGLDLGDGEWGRLTLTTDDTQ